MITLPRLTITWHKEGSGELAVHDGVFPGGHGLEIGVAGYRPAPVVRSNAARSVVVIGAPVIEERVSPTRVADAALTAEDPEQFARRLNGQFLVLSLEKASKTLTVINDRFNGLPLYWADLGDRLVASYLYVDLFRLLRQTPGFAFRPETMLQFLWLNRAIGDATHDTRSRYLTSATILTSTPSGTSTRRYWRPDFTKNRTRTETQAGEEFTGHLKTSLRRLTSDETPRRYGHFLSGGHDSRVVLGAFPEPPACFTVAFSDNLEVDCARRAAAAVGAPHHFLQLPVDQLTRNYESSVELCSGLYTFEGALFLGLEEQVQAHADVVFHGHALDYLFQGMYLPAHWVHLFGRPTFFRKLDPLTGDLVDRYLQTISFRVKGVDIPSLMQDNARKSALEGLRANVTAVLEEADDCAQTEADRWEYLIIHALGRHYSHPNITSKLSCAEQRTPSFDVDLFDFYLSLPPEHRVNAQVMRYALNHLKPALAAIPTGNWGIAAGASPAYKTAWLIGRKVLRHLTGNSRFRAPALEDRTWPNREQYLRQSPMLLNEIRATVASQDLRDALPFFDWTKVSAQVEAWLSAPSGGGAFMMALMTLNRFLTTTR